MGERRHQGLERGLLAALLLLVGCAAPSQPERSQAERAQAGPLENARTELESRRARNPGDGQTRLGLCIVYYQIAREAIDVRKDEARYMAHLEQAVDECVTALEIAPEAGEPHFWMAVMDFYRGDLDAALRGFHNARRLRRSGIDYTNLGEIYVYRGNLEEARRWTLRGLRSGAGAGPTTFNQMLIHWKAGNLRAAERDFEVLWEDYPQLLATINMAPVPREPDTFEEFAEYCCGSPACGPYMKQPCQKLGFQVEERALSNANALRELQIEMEKTRRLKEVYEGRKDLQIEVEEPEAPATE